MRNPNEYLSIFDGSLERRYFQPTFLPRTVADLPVRNLRHHEIPTTWTVTFQRIEVVQDGKVLHTAHGGTQKITIPRQKTSSAIALTHNGWFPVGFDPWNSAPLYLLDVNMINRIKNIRKAPSKKTDKSSEEDLIHLLNDKGSFVSPIPILIEGNPRRSQIGNGPISHERDLIRTLKECLPEANVIAHDQHGYTAKTAVKLRTLTDIVFKKEVALYEYAVPLLKGTKGNQVVIEEIDRYVRHLELFGTSLMRVALLAAAAGGKKNDNWFRRLLKIDEANIAPNVAADFRHLYLLLLLRAPEYLGGCCFLTQDLLLAKFWCAINLDRSSQDVMNGVARWDMFVDSSSAPQLSSFDIDMLKDVRQA